VYRNSLGLPVAALFAALLGFFTLAADLGWLHVAHAPAGGPVVDGKIMPGEYAHQYTDKGISMTIYWTVIGDEISLAAQSPGKGWIAVGWGGEGPLMEGFDIAIGYVDSAGAHFADNFADEPVAHHADTELGGTADILQAAGSETKDGTVFEWRRKLVTGDTLYDKPFHAGTMPVIMAYSMDAKDFATYHDTHRATAQIDFLGAAATQRRLIPEHLTEYQIGLLAWVLVLAVYGVVGLASVWLEGEEPVPGRHEASPGPGATGILAVSALAAMAGMVVFIWRVIRGTGPAWALGLSGTFWMWSLALVLVVYRRHFMRDEVIEQDRDEEIPW
jgi:hypothetical protein